MRMEYHGVFELGVAGCFTEEELKVEIANHDKPNPSSGLGVSAEVINSFILSSS